MYYIRHSLENSGEKKEWIQIKTPLQDTTLEVTFEHNSHTDSNLPGFMQIQTYLDFKLAFNYYPGLQCSH